MLKDLAQDTFECDSCGVEFTRVGFDADRPRDPQWAFCDTCVAEYLQERASQRHQLHRGG